MRSCAAERSLRRSASTAADRSCSTPTSNACAHPRRECGYPRPTCRSVTGSPRSSSTPPARPSSRCASSGQAATLVASVGPIDPDLEQLRARGLRLAVVRSSRGALARAKSTSYAENMIAQEDAIELGADDALLVGPDGIVLEAPTANIWWRTGDRLFTPSLELADPRRRDPLAAARSLARPGRRGRLPARAPPRRRRGVPHFIHPRGNARTCDRREGVRPGPAAAALQAALRERAREKF